jgi:hypothetical protein
MPNNRRRIMQRLRSNQQRNRRVALLHDNKTIINNENAEVQGEKPDTDIMPKQENNGLKP